MTCITRFSAQKVFFRLTVMVHVDFHIIFDVRGSLITNVGVCKVLFWTSRRRTYENNAVRSRSHFWFFARNSNVFISCRYVQSSNRNSCSWCYLIWTRKPNGVLQYVGWATVFAALKRSRCPLVTSHALFTTVWKRTAGLGGGACEAEITRKKSLWIATFTHTNKMFLKLLK